MKYFLGFLVSIGLIIGVFLLIMRGFHSGTPKVEANPLINYASTNTVMQFTEEGAINADQDHRAIRVTVGQTMVTIQTLSGYDENVISTKSYDNTTSSYAEFLRALDIAGYTKGNTVSTKKDDRGYCPTGVRYIFQIIDESGESKQRFWKTSCGQGNFSGNTTTILTLFRKQVPDYSSISSSITLD